MTPATRFAVVAGVLMLMALLGLGALALVLTGRPVPTAAAAARPAKGKAGAGAVSLPPHQTTSARYQGRTLDEWLADFHDLEGSRQAEAVRALSSFGRAAARPMAEALEGNRWEDACQVLENLGSDAYEALPALREFERRSAGRPGAEVKTKTARHAIAVIEKQRPVTRP